MYSGSLSVPQEELCCPTPSLEILRSLRRRHPFCLLFSPILTGVWFVKLYLSIRETYHSLYVTHIRRCVLEIGHHGLQPVCMSTSLFHFIFLGRAFIPSIQDVITKSDFLRPFYFPLLVASVPQNYGLHARRAQI